MPTGYVKVQYMGGPWDGKTEVLPAFSCRDTMGIVLDVWIGERPEGGVELMKGPRGEAWESYSYALYEKDARRANDEGATYRFVRNVEVRRCAKLLETKGRRCKKPAVEGGRLCRDHEKIRTRSA